MGNDSWFIRTQPTKKEFVESLRNTEQGIIFDPEDPEQWSAALRAQLLEELDVLLSPEDLRYVRAYIELAKRADWSNREDWRAYVTSLQGDEAPQATEIVVSEVVLSGPPPRCDPSDPQPGHLNMGDPDHWPVHGTQRRYNKQGVACRCKYCRDANYRYRKGLEGEVIALPSDGTFAAHDESDRDSGRRGVREGDSSTRHTGNSR